MHLLEMNSHLIKSKEQNVSFAAFLDASVAILRGAGGSKKALQLSNWATMFLLVPFNLRKNRIMQVNFFRSLDMEEFIKRIVADYDLVKEVATC